MLTATSHSPSLLSSASHLSQICEQRETINSDNYVADLGLARDSTVGADDPTSTDRMSLMAVEADRGRGWIADRLLIDFGFYEPCQVSHDQYRGSESVSPKKSLVKIGEPSHTRRFASEKGLRKGSFRQTGLNLDIRLGSCVSAMGSSKSWIEAAKKRLHHNVLAIALANARPSAGVPRCAHSRTKIG